MKKLILVCVIVFPVCASAQFDPNHKPAADPTPKADFGIGLGLDYGGIGGRLTYLPEKHFGLFGSAGYALAGLGYNFGAIARFNPDSRFCVVAGAMYGYNGVIKVTGASQYDKIYYGPSVSVGVQMRSKNNPKNYFNIELLLPFRPQAFTDDLNKLKNNPAVSNISEPLPIGFSLGYHFGF